MKKKYSLLTKEEKLKIKNKFYNTDFGKNIKYRLNHLLMIAIIGIIFGIILIVTKTNMWELILGILLLITSIFFTISSFVIRNKQLNAYLLNQKNK